MYHKKPGKLGKDFKDFDIFGSAVAEESDFRVFKSADITLPLAYRGDMRPSEEIFKNGFSPRQMHKPPKYEALIHLGNMDMDVNYAVSLTLDFNVPVIFPFDAKKPPENGSKKTAQIYVCALDKWLEVYNLQKFVAPHLVYAMEVASLGVPPEHVLGMVTVEAQYVKPKNIFTFKLKELRKNDKCAKHFVWEHFCRKVYPPFGGGKQGEVQCSPGFKGDENIKRLSTADERYSVVKDILGYLKGDKDSSMNIVKNCDVPTLDLKPCKEIMENLVKGKPKPRFHEWT